MPHYRKLPNAVFGAQSPEPFINLKPSARAQCEGSNFRVLMPRPEGPSAGLGVGFTASGFRV